MRLRISGGFLPRTGWLLAGVFAAMVLSVGASRLHAQSGTVEGRVTDGSGTAPVRGALVQLVGTPIGMATDADG